MATYQDILDENSNAESQPSTYGNLLGQYEKKPGNFVTDTLQDIGKGALKLPGTVTGLADIPAGLSGMDRPFSRAADIVGEKTGFQPGKWAEQTQYSPERQQSMRNTREAWDAYNRGESSLPEAIGETLANPRALVGNIAESLPSMVAGGVGARALLGPKALAPAVGEGAVMAGQQMQNTDPAVDPQKAAALSLGTGVIGGALGYGGGKIAEKMGLIDPDTLIARGLTPDAARPGFLKGVGLGAAQEGLLEELPQSLIEQGSQNIAEERPITQGMAEAGVQGALAGGIMGGGFNAAAGPLSRAAQQVTPADAVSAAQNANPTGSLEEVINQAREVYHANVSPDGSPVTGSVDPVRPGPPASGTDDASNTPATPGASKEQALKDKINQQRQAAQEGVNDDQSIDGAATRHGATGGVVRRSGELPGNSAAGPVPDGRRTDGRGITGDVNGVSERTQTPQEADVHAAGTGESELKQPWQISKADYRSQNESLLAAKKSLDEARSSLGTGKGTRWGNSTRFSGEMAGNRIATVEKAQGRWSKAYDKAEYDHKKAVKQALQEGKPVLPEVLKDYPDLQNESTQNPITANRAHLVAQESVGQRKVSAQDLTESEGDATLQAQNNETVTNEFKKTTSPVPPAQPAAQNPDTLAPGITETSPGTQAEPVAAPNESAFSRLEKYVKTDKQGFLIDNGALEIALSAANNAKEKAALRKMAKKQKNGDVILHPDFLDEVSDSHLWTRDFLGQAVDRYESKQSAPTVAKSGKPFSTEKVAQQALKSSAYPETAATHEIVKVEGGYGLAPKGDVSNATLEQQKTIPSLTEEEYLAQQGFGRGMIGEAALHRSSKNISKKVWDKKVKAQFDKDSEVIAKRAELRQEYQQKIAAGGIRQPTLIEQRVRTANGHPDNEAVQAARRLLAKKGIDWKTYQPQETNAQPPEQNNLEGQPPKTTQTQEESRAQPSPEQALKRKLIEKRFAPQELDELRQRLETQQNTPDNITRYASSRFGPDRVKGVDLKDYFAQPVAQSNKESVKKKSFVQPAESAIPGVKSAFQSKPDQENKSTGGINTDTNDNYTLKVRQELANLRTKQKTSDSVLYMDQHVPYAEVFKRIKKAVDDGMVRNNAAQFNLEFNIPYDAADRIHAELSQPVAQKPAKTPEVKPNQGDAVAETVAPIKQQSSTEAAESAPSGAKPAAQSSNGQAKKPTTLSNKSDLSQEPAQKSPETIHVTDDVSKKGGKVDTKFSIANKSAEDFAKQVKDELGLKSFVVFERQNDIELSSLIVNKDEQRSGKGSEAMQRLTDYADSVGKRLILTPGLPNDNHGTTSRARLVKFYKRFGFKENKGRSIDYAMGAGKMYRDPGAKLSQNQPTTGSTREQVIAWLDKAERKDLASGRLNVAQSRGNIPEGLVSIDANDIEGFYDPQSKSVWIVADNVTKDSLPSVIRHEYLHAILAENPQLRERILGAQSELRDIFTQVESGKYTGRYKALYEEAMRRVDRAETSQDARFEEWLAYQVSSWAKAPQSLPERLAKAVQNLVAAIRAAIYKATGKIDKIGPAELSALARSAVNSSKNSGSSNGQVNDNAVAMASKLGYTGKDTSEALEWIRAKEKGLEMSHEARMQRAKAIGFNVSKKWYHGTLEDIKHFSEGLAGIFFTGNPKFANTFAFRDGPSKSFNAGSPNIIPVFLRYGESFDYENKALRDRLIERVFNDTETYTQGNGDKALLINGEKTLFTKGVLELDLKDGEWAVLESEPVLKAMKKLGFDSYFVNEDGEKNIAVFNDTQIRSIHAAFDPDYKNSGNILASVKESPDIRYSVADDVRDGVDRLLNRQQQNSTDPNAELNRRIREQHKTVSDRAKQWLKREFAPGGLLPKQVFDLKISRDSEMNAEELISHNLVANLDRVIKSEFGKKLEDLTQEQKDLIDARLKGETVNLPQSVVDSIDAMRLHVDRLSARYAATLFDEATKLQEEGKDAAAAAKVQLLNTIAGNIGKYVNRSYRAFDDENWPRKVPDDVLNNARQYFVNRFTEKGAENPTGDAQRVMNDILKTGTAYDTFEQYIKESKLGAKDLSMLIKRKEIAPEVRALLGEYKDARVNFVKSATKMSRLIFNDDFLKQVKTAGLVTEENQNGFLFDENNRPSDEHTVKIAADASSPMAPLNGLYTYPEINQAFTDALNRESMEDWYRFIVQTNGLVKYGKTVLSPTTAIRNWMSAYFFTLANGHFDMSHMKESMESFKTYFDRDNGRLDYLTKLKRLGVIYDTPYAGEMMALLADSKFESALMGEGRSKIDKAKVAIKDWMDMATKFYQFGDDWWKIVGFENEKQSLMKYRGMSESEAEVEAAKRIRDTYPTYSMVGRAINKLRRFPLVGTFVSFPAEILRTSFNMLKYAQEDMQHSKELGRRRIAGLSMVSGFAFAAQMLAMSLTGMDDDEEEALRDLAPPWSKNSNIIPLGRDKDGSLIYLDLSFLDPYNYFKRPLNAILRGQSIDETVYEIGRELLTPFFGQDIAFGAITDVWQNKKDSGGRVFNPNDSASNITLDIANHLRKALQPGIASNIERMSDALTGYKSQSGKVNTMTEELASLVGFRASRLNPKVALYYKSYEFQDKLKDASSILNDVARNPNKISSSELQSAYSQARETRSEAFTDMHELVNAAKKAGLSTSQIRTLLKLNHVSEKNINYILMGKEPKWTPGKTFLQSSIKKSGELFGSDTTSEFKKRRQFVLSE